MEPCNQEMEDCLRLAEEVVRRYVTCVGLYGNDAEECVAEFRKWRLAGCDAGDRSGATVGRVGSVRHSERSARWFAKRWIYDRTVVTTGTGGDVLRNVDIETIAAIVNTLTVSSRWLWRRVELDGARLKDLAAETGVTPDSLNRDLCQIKRRIRRVLDAENGGRE